MTTTTNLGVARSWARKDAASKSSNGNFWHEGDVLYSYSTPIGCIVRGRMGDVYLITAETYSVTTEGKHKKAAHRATDYRAFVVPFLQLPMGTMLGRSRANRRAMTVAEQHDGNLEHYAALIEAEEQRLKRARTLTSRDHIARIQTERARYCAAFGLPPVGWDKVEG